MKADIHIGNRVKGLENYCVHDDAFFSSIYGDSVVNLDVPRPIFSYNEHSKLVTITVLVGFSRILKWCKSKSHFLIPLHDTALHIGLDGNMPRTTYKLH